MLLRHNLLWLSLMLPGAVAQQPVQGDKAWAYLVSQNSKAAAGMASYCKILGVTNAADCNAKFLTPRSGNLPPSSVTAKAANTCAEQASLAQAELKRVTDLMKTDFNKISRESSGQSIRPDLSWKTGDGGRRYRYFYSIGARETAGQKLKGGEIDLTVQATITGASITIADKAMGIGAAKVGEGAGGVAAAGRTALTSGLLGVVVAALGGLNVYTNYWEGYMLPWLAGVEPDAIFYGGDSSGTMIKDGSSVIYDEKTADTMVDAVESENVQNSEGNYKNEEGGGTTGSGGTKVGSEKKKTGGDDGGSSGDTDGDGDVWDDATFNDGDLQPELETSTPMITDEATRTSFQRCVEAEEAKIWAVIGSVTIDPDAESPEVRKSNALQQLNKFGICDTHVLGTAFCQDWKNEQAKHPIPKDEVETVKALVPGTHLCVGSLLGPQACKFLKEELWKHYFVRDEVAQVADSLFTTAPNSGNVRVPQAPEVLGTLSGKLLGDEAAAAVAGAGFPLLGSSRRLPVRPITAKELKDASKAGAGFIPSMGSLHAVPGAKPGTGLFGHDEL